ncbi:MAG: SCO family protein [Candidatus Hydrogenedentota bacterium]
MRLTTHANRAGSPADRGRGPGLALGALLLAAAILAPAPAMGQAGGTTSNSVNFDPVSFTGPDPKERFQDIKIVQQIDSQVPLDLTFENEKGEQVTLGAFMGDKPVVLALVYYECEMLCNRVLNTLRDTLANDNLELVLGDDFEVVTISIDPEETPELAAAKKANYIADLHSGAQDGWHFLTGAEIQIEEVAQSVGFRYYYDEKSDQFAHDAGIIILTPGGTVSSYLLGLDYPPNKLEPALIMASNGAVGSVVERTVVLLCFGYDPESGYGFKVFLALRALGTIVLVGLLSFWGIMFWRGRRKPHRRTPEQAAAQGTHHASHEHSGF